MAKATARKSKSTTKQKSDLTEVALQKCPTGIVGLDEITYGGLPRGRPTLICGGPGCGKSLLGLEFLMRGITEFGEPGVMLTFEETADDIRKNVASLGFDLDKLVKEKKLVIDYIKINSQEIEENGEYDLEGIFIRLAYAIEQVGAKRVMLDTIETLFSGLTNQGILRAEIQRLFYWLKEKGMTTVITAERGEGALTRQGLEEYVSDCVILLDHRVINQVSTRRLRVVKYRGTTHGTNEYPFLIDEDGISVLPVTSLGLNHSTSSERVSSGVPRLDTMLGGKGYYRGASILVTGSAGTGKSTLSATFVNSICNSGKRAIYFAFEESQAQICRNMKSIGIDLQKHVDAGLLKFYTVRPMLHGLEMHLAVMHKLINSFKPDAVAVDPVTNLLTVGTELDAHAMLIRLVDFLKTNLITGLFISLTSGDEAKEGTELGISSIMDTWLLLRDIEFGGERNRGMYVIKSRGMHHSNQIREFVITSKGIDLLDVYVGPEGVLTGSARVSQESRERSEKLIREREIERKKAELNRRRSILDAQIAAMREEFAEEEKQAVHAREIDEAIEAQHAIDRASMASRRFADDTNQRPSNTPTVTTKSGKARKSTR